MPTREEINALIRKEQNSKRLFDAVNRGDKEAAKDLLELGPDEININVKNRYDQTPLHIAAEKGCTETVELLLKEGADINAENSDGQTPLHEAVWNGYTETVKLLLDKKANVNTKDNYGKTALDYASERSHNDSERSHNDIVGILIQRIRQQKNSQNLLDALKRGDKEAVEILLELGPNEIDINDEECGVTPLHLASSIGYIDIIRMLLEKGADINAQDNYGQTPLYYASGQNNVEIVRMLLEGGADIEAKDKSGETVLYQAVRSKNAEMIELLLNRGADIEAKDNSGETALDLAARYEYHDIAVMLKQKNMHQEQSSNHSPSKPSPRPSKARLGKNSKKLKGPKR